MFFSIFSQASFFLLLIVERLRTVTTIMPARPPQREADIAGLI
jgi:hypothetical protein